MRRKWERCGDKESEEAIDTDDGEDNKTSPEERASASVMFSRDEVLRDCESSKHAVRKGTSTPAKAISGSQGESDA